MLTIKKLFLILFLMPNLVIGGSKDVEKYICSSNTEDSYMFDANKYKSDVDPSLWTTFPEDTMLIEIDYVRKTITTTQNIKEMDITKCVQVFLVISTHI